MALTRTGPRAILSTLVFDRARDCTSTCTKHGRRVCVACALQTAFFPVEHFLWARVLGVTF